MKALSITVVALVVVSMMLASVGAIPSLEPQGNEQHIHDTETGHVTIEREVDPSEAEALKPLKQSHPDLCTKVINYYQPLVKAKAEANLELKLFHTAASLARDLEEKMQEHKKHDHEHFDCHEAKDLLSMSSGKDTVEMFRKLLHVPIKGHTGESVEDTLREMQQALNSAQLISNDAFEEFEDVINDLKLLHKQYDVIKADFDAVMTEHADCKKNFQNFIKETLDLTHDHIPKWEHLEWGMDSLVDQCQKDEL